MDVRCVEVKDVLRARDARVARQREMLDKYGCPVISFTMNIAGEIKRDEWIDRAFLLGVHRVEKQLEWHGIAVLESVKIMEFTGCEMIWSAQAPAAELKAWMRAIEEADEIGRLFDLDVIDSDGAKLSREKDRRCLICNASARDCGRSRRHPAQEIYLRARGIIRNHFEAERADAIARCGEQALLCEAVCAPKPGLVDRENCGAHRDMDIFSFVRSASALRSYFAACARLGMVGNRDLEPLRLLGRETEEEMLRATGGANTHKGAIFSIGILCCAAGAAGEDDDIPAIAAGIAEPALRELEAMPADRAATGGERQYAQYGLTGVRGEAAAGFPSVKNIALPALERALAEGMNLNDAGLQALVALMARVLDSNIIRRCGMETQLRVQAHCMALEENGFYPEELRAMNEEFVRENISPGGCADLLAAAYFLHFYKGENNKA